MRRLSTAGLVALLVASAAASAPSVVLDTGRQVRVLLRPGTPAGCVFLPGFDEGDPDTVEEVVRARRPGLGFTDEDALRLERRHFGYRVVWVVELEDRRWGVELQRARGNGR